MNKFKTVILTLMTLVLSACGSTPQPTIELQSQLLNQEKRVGIYVTEIEAPTTSIFGASCLLCYGVAAAANSSLDKHLESLPSSDLASTKEIIYEGYKKQTNAIKFIELDSKTLKNLKKFKGGLGFAKKDFRTLKEKNNIDVLVVLQYWAHGAYRSYQGYIPTSDPQGYVAGIVYSVDLEDNKYLQYQELDKKVVVSGEWDEPKQQFPGVTNAYYQAIEQAKVSLEKIFL
ncbi:hypothetical protein [Pseudoalteromonas sp. MMG005]|uniref:hypothetical protein n=1 Tax=Pseudoalteromonas sp. MMG005 TaxID=2822682 RepID=UPI001FFC7A1F|nr:hypothetical protein [Pseudoalteromonas sp. MMG005]